MIYEVASRSDRDAYIGPGRFFELEAIVQESAIGVLLVALIAWLILRSLPAQRHTGV